MTVEELEDVVVAQNVLLRSAKEDIADLCRVLEDSLSERTHKLIAAYREKWGIK